MIAPHHPDYKALAPKWRYAWDVYTGEYVDQDRIASYLIQRLQGEADEAYKERKQLADPALDFAAVVDSLTGLVFAGDDQTARTWQAPDRDSGLGDPDVPGSIAHRLSNDIDGSGTNMDTLLKRAATRLGVQHRVWCLVDGVIVDRTSASGDTRSPEGSGSSRAVLKHATVHLIDPRDVVSWKERYGRLVDVLVRDNEDQRTDALDTRSAVRRYYVRYTDEGWQHYVETEAGLRPEGALQPYAFWRTAERRVRILPIFYVDLPMLRMSGYLLARKCISLFNTESEIDNLGRLTCMPRFGVDTREGVVDFEQVRSDIAKGHAIIEGTTHAYIAPEGDNMSVRMERLKQKRADFYAVGFREYGDAARQATATERRQDWAAGVVAYLQLLAGALEELEVQMMWRMEQAEFPDRPERWGQYRVKRSREFQPEDIRRQMQDLKTAVFGLDPLPVPESVAAGVVRRVLEQHGIAVRAEDIEESVRQYYDRRDQGRDVENIFAR